MLPACRRLLFPLLHADFLCCTRIFHSGTKYIGHLVSFTVLNLEDSGRHVY